MYHFEAALGVHFLCVQTEDSDFVLAYQSPQVCALEQAGS